MALTPRTRSQEFFSDFSRNLEQIPGRQDISRKINENSCLLYTSPSPRDRTRSRMPSSA